MAQSIRFELLGDASDLQGAFTNAAGSAEAMEGALGGLEESVETLIQGQVELNEVAGRWTDESGTFISSAEAQERALQDLNSVGVESTQQVREQIERLESLRAIYADDAKAASELSEKQQRLRTELAEVGEAAAQQNQDLSRLDERFEQSTVTMTDFASRQQLLQQELQESAQAQRQFASASGSADQAVVALSRGMEDVAFARDFGDAMRFAGNNVSQAAQSFGQARAEAGGLLATLRGVSPAVLGVGAFSALVALGPRLVSFFNDGEDAASDFKDTLSEVSGEVVTLNAAINDTEFEVPAEQLGKYRENLESSLSEQRALIAALEQSTRGLSTLRSEAADVGRSLLNTAFGADFELTQEQALRGAEEAARRLGLEVETVRDAIRGNQDALLKVESTLREQPAILENAEERQQALNQLLEDAEAATQRQQARQEALSAAQEEAGTQLEENENTTDEIAKAQRRINRAVEQEIIAREEAKTLLEDLGTSNDQIARSTARALGSAGGFKQQFADLLSLQGKILAQARRTKEQYQKQAEALKNVNRILARREAGIQAQQVMPAGPGSLGEMPLVHQSIQELSGQPNVLQQYAQRLKAAKIQAQELNQALQDIELAGGPEELGEETKQTTEEGTEEGISAGARAGAQTLSAVMSTTISEITRDIENKWARAITNAAAQALASEAVQQLRGVLSGSGGGGGAGGSGAGLLALSRGGGAGGAGSAASSAAAGSSSLAVGLGGAAAGFGVGNILGRVVRPDKNEGAALGSLGGAGLGAILGSIVPGIGTAVGGLVGGGLGGLLAGSFAEGGKVRGEGGTTEDRIPALLSDREFVMRAASAQEAPELLQVMNDDPAVAKALEETLTQMSPAALSGGRQATPIEQAAALPPVKRVPEEFARGGFVRGGGSGIDDAVSPRVMQETVMQRASRDAATPVPASGPTPSSRKRETTVKHVYEIETEMKRINRRELALMVRGANDIRDQYGYNA